jgi:hypothetical protein
MLMLNKFIYKVFYEKEKNRKFWFIVQMYEIVKIQMHFQSTDLIFCFSKMCTCVHFEKIFKNELNFFSFGQSMKNIIMVKVGYFCMKQRTIWDNVEMFCFY